MPFIGLYVKQQSVAPPRRGKNKVVIVDRKRASALGELSPEIVTIAAVSDILLDMY